MSRSIREVLLRNKIDLLVAESVIEEYTEEQKKEAYGMRDKILELVGQNHENYRSVGLTLAYHTQLISASEYALKKIEEQKTLPKGFFVPGKETVN